MALANLPHVITMVNCVLTCLPVEIVSFFTIGGIAFFIVPLRPVKAHNIASHAIIVLKKY